MWTALEKFICAVYLLSKLALILQMNGYVQLSICIIIHQHKFVVESLGFKIYPEHGGVMCCVDMPCYFVLSHVDHANYMTNMHFGILWHGLV